MSRYEETGRRFEDASQSINRRLVGSNGWLAASMMAAEERHNRQIGQAEQSWLLRGKAKADRQRGIRFTLLRQRVGNGIISLGHRIGGADEELVIANQ